MRTVEVSKSELRTIVLKNRDNHRQVFETAMEAFKKAARARLEEHLAILEKGQTPPLQLGLVVPEDHTVDYDTVLEMLDMEVNPTVELQWDEFRNYVQDEWGWTDRFSASTAAYGVTNKRPR